MASEIKVDTISEKTSTNGVTIDSLSIKDGGLIAEGNIDVNGNNLVLDANANTYLDAGTDDTIKFYVSGAHDLTISANAINVLSGTTLTIDSGATIANSGTATGFSSADPASADGDTLGTASAEWSDLYLADSSVIYFGNDQDTTLTHTDGTGLTLNSTNKLCFNDATQFIQGASGTVLDIAATDEIELTSTEVELNVTTFDVNGATDLSGALTIGGVTSFPDGSAGAPSITNTGDTNTGFLWSAADKMQFTAGGTAQVTLQDGAIVPVTDNTIDLGTSSLEFKDAYFDGIMEADTTTTPTINCNGGSGIRSGSSGGDLLVYGGATHPGGQIQLFGGSGDNDIEFSTGTQGSMTVHFKIASNGDLTGTDTSIGSISDQRLKQNIEDYTYDVNAFKQLEPKTFNWKNPSKHGGSATQRGFISQDLQSVDDYWIGETEVDSDSPDYSLLDAVTKNNCVLNVNGKIITSDISESDWEAGKLDTTYPEDSTWTASSAGDRIAMTSKLGKKDAMYISVIKQLITRIEALEG